MAVGDFTFERDCRTPNSESYSIIDGERALGRVDLHFTATVVHGSLCVDEGLTGEDVRELIQAIDQELVDVLGVQRQELIIHVFSGREVGVYGDHGFDNNGNGHDRL